MEEPKGEHTRVFTEALSTELGAIDPSTIFEPTLANLAVTSSTLVDVASSTELASIDFPTRVEPSFTTADPKEEVRN